MKRLLSLLTVFCLCLAIVAPSKVEAAALKLSKAKATMEVDSTLKLKLGSIKATSVSWKSSNTKIASVAKTGTITAQKEGTTNITATYKNKKYTCDVTVVDSNKANAKKGFYSLGETWTVDEQWNLTFDSVTTTDDRNQFSDKNPNQVIILKYSYENIGYEGVMQGLYISSSNMSVVDDNSQVATSYPADTSVSPESTPIGAKCVGVEEAYGLYNESKTVTVYVEVYGKGFKSQKAKFVLNVD